MKNITSKVLFDRKIIFVLHMRIMTHVYIGSALGYTFTKVLSPGTTDSSIYLYVSDSDLPLKIKSSLNELSDGSNSS